MNTAEMQSRLDATGVLQLPAGEHTLDQTLMLNTQGAKIIGQGPSSIIKSTTDFGFGIAVPHGVRGVQLRDFDMQGPAIVGSEEHRAILINSVADGSINSSVSYLAEALIERVNVRDWTSAFHISLAGDVRVLNSSAWDVTGTEEGMGYAVTASGYDILVDGLRAINKRSKNQGRHAIYFNGPSKWMTARRSVAVGYPRSPFQGRFTDDDNEGIVWDDLTARDCNYIAPLNSGVLTMRHIDTAKRVVGVRASRLKFIRCGGIGVMIENCDQVSLLAADLVDQEEDGRLFRKFNFDRCDNILLGALSCRGIDDPNTSALLFQRCNGAMGGTLLVEGPRAKSLVTTDTNCFNLHMPAGNLTSRVDTVERSLFDDNSSGNAGMALGT